MTFEKCKHEDFTGRCGYDGSGNLMFFSGFCLDCRWNMKFNIKKQKWEKTTWFTVKEANELKEYRELRGLK